MIVVWILTAIMQSLHWLPAVELWHWFGEHVIITILMIVFLA